MKGSGTDITVEGGKKFATTKGSSASPFVCGDVFGNGYLGSGETVITVKGGRLEETAFAANAKAASAPIQFVGEAVASLEISRNGRDFYKTDMNNQYHWLLYPASAAFPEAVVPVTGDDEAPFIWAVCGCVSLAAIAFLLYWRKKQTV